MQTAKGVAGYSQAIQKYIQSTHEIPFDILHKDFLPFIPGPNKRIIDLGAGFGRDAFHLSQSGHSVLAVEPLADFRKVGQKMYRSDTLQWVNDFLPDLQKLERFNGSFDFALSSGVWHHLNEKDQETAIKRVSELLRPGGIFALSLRNGPAGLGTYIFPINIERTIKSAKDHGFELLLELKDQPSLMKHKEHVKWSRLVLKRKL